MKSPPHAAGVANVARIANVAGIADPGPALRAMLVIALVVLSAISARAAGLNAEDFARAEIARAARRAGAPAPRVGFRLEAALAPQAYRIVHDTDGGFSVLAGDETGAMYGGLDLAEAIGLGEQDRIAGNVHTPFIARRGIKFNLPLDLRTPSYSDNGDSFQANIPEVWSLDFWRAFLDEMARDRYNVLSLWNLHPFPSLVRVPEFPRIALDDVWRTTAKLDDTFNTNGKDMVRPYMLAQHEVVRKLTMEEKIAFWREVMRYARSRGIDVYLFTWNIFVWGTEGQYGITWDQDNPTTLAYFRDSVRETVRTYPLLAGIGITAGEHMNPRLTGDNATENWLWRTYGQGITDALKDEPGRQFRLIHRLHQTNPATLVAAFRAYPGPFDFEYKYSVAHMYSLPDPPFIRELLPSLGHPWRTWGTLRNDDIYTFRWGDPDYARDYVRAIPPPDKVAGYLMGCDGYCWGREAIEREPLSPRQLVMQRQWYSFLLWGRLSFDPSIPDGHFERILAAHFPEVPGDRLYLASSTASKIIPQITRFFWGDIDIRWFPELCTHLPTPSGFYTVKDFMLGVTMPGSGLENIRQWRQRVAAGRSGGMRERGDVGGDAPPDRSPPRTRRSLDRMDPPAVAARLADWAERTLALVAELRPRQGADRELRLTLGDYAAFAHLGNYYSEKIRGACDLARFDLNGDPRLRDSTVAHLERALGHWRRYAAVVTRQYVPQLLNRVGNSDPNRLTPRVAADIDLARNWKPGALSASSP